MGYWQLPGLQTALNQQLCLSCMCKKQQPLDFLSWYFLPVFEDSQEHYKNTSHRSWGKVEITSASLCWTVSSNAAKPSEGDCPQTFQVSAPVPFKYVSLLRTVNYSSASRLTQTSNPPHFMCGPQFPSHRWYIWFKREETSRRGQFYSIWFRRVRFRLPLVEKYVSEYHFLIDFPNGATDAKQEVNTQQVRLF